MRGSSPRGWLVALLASTIPVSAALAEVSDKIAGSREHGWMITGVLLLLSALAAASGWHRALLLWPVTLLWGLIALGEVWEWRDSLQQEGATDLLWGGCLTAAAMLLGPPLFAVVAWRRQLVTG